MSWHDPLNWSNNQIPTAVDDVTISVAANPTILYNTTTGTRTINSLVSDEHLNFTGGNLTVLTTADVNATLDLDGGTLTDGTWDFSGGKLNPHSATNTLMDVTLLDELVIDSETSARVRVRGTTTMPSLRLAASSAAVGFDNGATIAFDIFFEGTGSKFVEANASGATVTIGSTANLQTAPGFTGTALIGQGAFFGGIGTLINEGTITSSVAGRIVRINPNGSGSTFTNNGVVEAADGGEIDFPTNITVTNAGTTTLTGGTWIVRGGSDMTIGPNPFTTNDATVIIDGMASEITNFTGTLAVNDGTLRIQNGGTFTTSGNFLNNALLDMGPSGTLAVAGDFTNDAGAELRSEMAGSANSLIGRVTTTGQAFLDGTITGEFVGGYVPMEGVAHNVIDAAGGVVDQFATINYPTPASGDKIVLRYNVNQVDFVTTDVADLNEDGVLDLFDFLQFTNWFNTMDPRADITGDGLFDLFDFLAYLNLFNDG